MDGNDKDGKIEIWELLDFTSDDLLQGEVLT